MRNRILSLLVLFTFFVSSCAQIAIEEQPKEYVQFSVTVCLDTTVTAKTHMVDSCTGNVETSVGKVKWSSTDYLTLYNSDSKYVTGKKSGFATEISRDSSSAVFIFSFEKKASATYVQDFNNYLVYGEQVEKVIFEDGIPTFQTSLKADQIHAGTKCFNEFENLAFGICPKGSFKVEGDDSRFVATAPCVLHNLFGILKVKVQLTNGTSGDIKYVRLTDNTPGNDHYLAGTFDVSVNSTTGVPTMTHVASTGGESLTIEKKIPAGTLTSEHPYLYFLVPPGTLFGNNGFDIAVYTNSGIYGGKTYVKPELSIERSKILQIDFNGFKPIPVPVPQPYTANSYIFSDSRGVGTFPAGYKGNGYQGNGGDVTAKASANTITYSSDYYAEIIWQTKCNGDNLLAAEVVSCPVYYNTSKGPCISFNKTGVPGDALIALRNPNRKEAVQQLVGPPKEVDQIIWSWHVWIANDTTNLKAGVDLYNNEGNKIFTIMDRNLGALYSSPLKGSQSHGLGYQYGRKDPFMQSRITSGQGESNYASYASIFPATGIYTIEDSNYSLSGSVQVPYIRLMNSNRSWSTGNVDWGDPACTLSVHTNKSLYDPCPVGWRVVEEAYLGELWGVSATSTWNKPAGKVYSIDSNTGKAFSLQNEHGTKAVEFPAAGYALEQENVKHVGSNVFFWGSTSDLSYSTGGVRVQATAIEFKLNKCGDYETSDYEFSTATINKNATMPVRCQKWDEPTVTQ